MKSAKQDSVRYSKVTFKSLLTVLLVFLESLNLILMEKDLSIYPSIHLSPFISIYFSLSINLFIYPILSFNLYIYQSIISMCIFYFLSVYFLFFLHIYLSICQPIYPSILSICLSIYPIYLNLYSVYIS